MVVKNKAKRKTIKKSKTKTKKKETKKKTRITEKQTKKPVKTKTKIKAIFTGETVHSNTKEAISLYNQSRFGELKSGKIIYSMFEALYLLEKKQNRGLTWKKKIKF